MAGFLLPSERGLPSAVADSATRSGHLLSPAFAGLALVLDDALADIDRGRIERRLDVSGVEFLDHLDTRAAILRDLMDVGTLYQAEADVGVASCSSCADCLSCRCLVVVGGFDILAPSWR